MKIIKVLKSLNEIQAYVKVSKDCKIFDTHYAALQLVREKHNDRNINGTQLLDIEHNEKMQAAIPVYTLNNPSEESLKIKTKPAAQPVRDSKKSHTD